jgi:hypothetical protein
MSSETLNLSLAPENDIFDPLQPMPQYDELSWLLDPALEMPAANKEQEDIFQTIWYDQQNDAARDNLYAMLLGNTLGI